MATNSLLYSVNKQKFIFIYKRIKRNVFVYAIFKEIRKRKKKNGERKTQKYQILRRLLFVSIEHINMWNK